MNIAELLHSLVSVPTFLIAVLVYGFAPGLILRLIVLLYPRDNPRRAELIAELYDMARLKRPFWVAEQIETALFDGLATRCRVRRYRRHHRETNTVPVVLAGECLGRLNAFVGGAGTGKSYFMKKLIQSTVSVSKSGVAINGEPVQAVGQIVFDVYGEYANQRVDDAPIDEQYSTNVARYGLLARPDRGLLKPGCPRSVTDIIGHLRLGRLVIIDLSGSTLDAQRACVDFLSEAILNEAVDRFVHQRQANAIQMYFEEAHNLLPPNGNTNRGHVYERIAMQGRAFRIGLCYTAHVANSIPHTMRANTHSWFNCHFTNRSYPD